MAYMSQNNKKLLAPLIKKVMDKFNMKGSLGVNNHSTLVMNLKSGPLFKQCDGSYEQVNNYWIEEHWSGLQKAFLVELNEVMSVGNHDNSDIQSDYFDVGWYVDINIGKWNKPYVCVA